MLEADRLHAAARRALKSAERVAPPAVKREPIDDVIAATASQMGAKYPQKRASQGERFEQSVARQSRDRSVADRIAARAAPMAFNDGTAPRVVLPPGAGRKPTRKD